MKARRGIGEKIGSSSAKSRIIAQALTNRNTRTLYNNDLTTIPQMLTASNISERERAIVNVRGFKICIEVENLENNSIYFNWAVLATKGATNVVQNSDFFRAQDNGSTRSTDFSTSLTSNEFRCLPINADNYYILKHERYHIAGVTDNTGFTRKDIDRWVPLKRQLRFSGTGSTSCENPVFVVYWADRAMTAAGAAAVASAFQIQMKTITYFREPKT